MMKIHSMINADTEDTVCEEEEVMNRHYPRSIPVMLSSLSVFLLLAMMCTLSPVAFAASSTSQHSSFQFSEDIARAGVSVVRLVVSYSPAASGGQVPTRQNNSKTASNTGSTGSTDSLFSAKPQTGNSITCTGLGFIVASWGNATTSTPTTSTTPLATATATASDNTWIMTDGTLVNKSGTPKATACSTNAVQNKAPLTLSSITVYFSSAYNSNDIMLPVPTSTVLCETPDTSTCTTGPVLVGFTSTRLYPYLDVSQAASNPPAGAGTTVAGIALSNTTSTLAVPTATTTASQDFITPIKVAVNSMAVPQLETPANTQFGMPVVNAQGLIQGMYASAPTGPAGSLPASIVPSGQLQGMLTSKNIHPNTNEHPNLVETNWNNGIADIAQGPSSYSNAHSAFTAIQQENAEFTGINTFLQLTASSSAGGSGSTAQTPPSPISQSEGIRLPLVGVVPFWLFILAITGIIILFILIILLSALFRRGRRHDFATITKQNSQPLNGDEISSQVVPGTQTSPPVPFIQPPQVPMPQLPQELSPALRPVHNGMSGMVVPTTPPSASAYSAPSAPIASAAPGSEAYKASIANQPTLVNFNQSTPSDGSIDGDATVPIRKPGEIQPVVPAQPVKELGFEIITNTNAGLKRMHKPNEDSIFAVHGVRDVNGILQQIGLFIVADGMGGHADGKAASTLAIQTIINHVLPRLMYHKEPLDNPAQLLAEGVQNANHAVHEHNMANHGDMGTTVTSTMLIGTTAYVANVGDSRTYLYRYPNGLSKITRDHSVVASLVDAGIIKEDDIYTHTKRNQIYRSLGEKPYVEVDTFVEQLQPGDKLLLCSDGMWEMVRDPKIRAILEEPTSNPMELGDRLIQAALDGGGEDNVSVIVVNVLESPNYEMKVGLEPIYQQEEVQLPVLG